MKRILLITAILFTAQINTAINTKRIGHVIKGIGSASVFSAGLYITKTLIESIPEKNINEIKENGFFESEFALPLTLVSVFMGYALFKSGKGTYKNFKKARQETNIINKENQQLNKKIKEELNNVQTLASNPPKKNRRNNRNR